MQNIWNWLQSPVDLLPCQVQTTSLIGPRADNQDNYLVIATTATGATTARWLKNGQPQETPRPGWPARWIRLAVMDGIGGHEQGGEIAEATALQLCKLPPCTSLDKQRTALLQLHSSLQNQFANGNVRSPGTTLIWAEIDRQLRVCHFVHLGDSRAWLWDGNAWKQLSWDHTPLEFNFRDGRINSLEYFTQYDQPGHRIAQALGYGSWGVRVDELGQEVFGLDPDLRIDTPASLPHFAQNHADSYTLKIPTGGLLLLASDGLWNAHEVCLPDPNAIAPNTAEELANAAVADGSQDNTTLVLGIFT